MEPRVKNEGEFDNESVFSTYETTSDSKSFYKGAIAANKQPFVNKSQFQDEIHYRTEQKTIGHSMIFDHVSKVYTDGTVALDNVNLTIKQGEFISIVGHSGAGKTTLLKMMLAEDKPTHGFVYFDSVDIHDLSRKEMNQYRRKIGMVFQDFRLLHNKTAYENIAFAMEASGREDEEIEQDVPYVLDLVDLSEKMWSFPGEMSGGQKQRLAIARAIINQPDILIADEPTGNLDPVNTYEVIQLLKKVNDLGTTVILTTHNKGVIDNLKARTITVDKGRIIRDDPDGSKTM